MAAAAIVFWTMPAPIVGAFLAIATVFQIVNGMQAVASGALRGYHDTKVPGPIAASAIGDRLCRRPALAFALRISPAGLWWGFVIGW